MTADPAAMPGPADENFKHSLEGLTRRLGERALPQTPAERKAAAAKHRAALLASERVRAQRLKLAFTIGGVMLGVAGTTFLIVMAAIAPEPAAPRVTAQAVRAPTVAVVAPVAVAAAATTEPAPPPPVPPPVAQEPVAAPAPIEEAALAPDDVREIQERLRNFGFNPGPLDGVAGAMTAAAVMHYEQDRMLPQTGTLDRQMLAQLRQDMAPPVPLPDVQVTQRAPRPVARRAPHPVQAGSDPFAPLQLAAYRFDQWMRSLMR